MPTSQRRQHANMPQKTPALGRKYMWQSKYKVTGNQIKYKTPCYSLTVMAQVSLWLEDHFYSSRSLVANLWHPCHSWLAVIESSRRFAVTVLGESTQRHARTEGASGVPKPVWFPCLPTNSCRGYDIPVYCVSVSLGALYWSQRYFWVCL